ncbi:hypothetical protein [Microcystis phage Mvi-JY20]|uniref:Uncharacterized protein n=1 Tax=Microcystis phage Mvi-JY20 TaxID=3128146 RepID=A0AAX4QGJ3_9CAUD
MANLYRVQMPIHASITVYVQAESLEDALEKANENYDGYTLSACWQCAEDIDEAMISGSTSINDVFEVDMSDSDEVEKAEEWINEH